MRYEPTWEEVSNNLHSICPDSTAVHRIVVEWDDSRGAQHYAYKAYNKDRVLVASGPVSDCVPIDHSADDRTLISALIWVGFGLETPIHNSDCIVDKTDDNVQSKYVVWDRDIKPKVRD